jgi:hypothetical protein
MLTWTPTRLVTRVGGWVAWQVVWCVQQGSGSVHKVECRWKCLKIVDRISPASSM